jgi:hypothetical protein
MKQQMSEIVQHSPTKIQVENKPVKEVLKFSQQQTPVPTRVTAEDLMGLSWTLFEDEEY